MARLVTPCEFLDYSPFHPFIYGLVDPLDPGHVRYVGMAGKYSHRPFFHSQYARRMFAKPSHLLHWVRKLHAEGRDYRVLILEELPIGTSHQFLGEIEKMYIKSLREIGHQLTNVSEGGCGGAILDAEGNARRAAKQIGNLRSFGSTKSEETRRKISESRKRFNEEHPEVVRRIAESQIGNTRALGFQHTDEAKDRIRQAKLGKPRSEETKKKISESRKRLFEERRGLTDPGNRRDAN